MFNMCKFDIPAGDFTRIKEFYASLFEWKFERVEGQDEFYKIKNPRDNVQKEVEGGLVQRSAPNQGIAVYIEVPSVEEYAAKVEELGGKVFVPKTAEPGEGYYACCLDPENNNFVIWETDETAG